MDVMVSRSFAEFATGQFMFPIEFLLAPASAPKDIVFHQSGAGLDMSRHSASGLVDTLPGPISSQAVGGRLGVGTLRTLRGAARGGKGSQVVKRFSGNLRQLLLDMEWL